MDIKHQGQAPKQPSKPVDKVALDKSIKQKEQAIKSGKIITKDE